MSIRSGVVTTLIGADKVIQSFVKYHLHIGFDRIYLFFDDPNDKSIDLVRSFREVTIIRHDASLRALWEQTELFKQKKYLAFLDKEVMTRQMLNAAVARDMAIQDCIDWLVHIDIDELFFSPRQSVGDHFKKLTRYGVATKQYPVYEAIPPRLHVNDFFREATIFRKNSDDYSHFKRHLRQRPLLYFKFYDTGKASARVNQIESTMIHKVVLRHKHKSLFAIIFDLLQFVRQFLLKFSSSAPVSFPIILHYPICGYDHFRAKYSILGKFEDKAFNERDVLPFHKLSRDVCLTDDDEKAIQFFKQNVMLKDKVLQKLLKANLVVEIKKPSQILDQINTSKDN